MVTMSPEAQSKIEKEHQNQIEAAFKQLLNEVWNSSIGSAIARLSVAVGNLLFSGISRSLTNYDRPDHTAIAYMRANVFAFSHAKSLVEMKALGNLVADKDNIKTFSEFERGAQSVNDRYNKHYLQTEFNTVVASGQGARRYLEVIADKDVYPYLRWDAIRDQRTRPSHARLDGITLPVNDSFWKSYWYPLDHNCRCEVRQVRSGRITSKSVAMQRAQEAVKRTSPFYGNAAASGIVIRKGHSYFTRKDYSRLRAVQDYGLREGGTIYEKGNLPRRPKGVKTKKEWEDLFTEWYLGNDGRDGKFSITDKLDRPVLLDAITRQRIKQYNLSAAIPEVLKDPDEIYSDDHKGRSSTKSLSYRYVKYFNDAPVIVVVESDKNDLRVSKVFDSTLKRLPSHRKGILHYVERL